MVTLQILNKVIQSSDISLIQNNDLTVDYFPEYEPEFEFIMNHYQTYGNVPDKETFSSVFPNFEYIQVTESDKYLLDTVFEEYNYSRMVEIIQKSADLLKSNSNDAVEYLKTAMTDINIKVGKTYIDIVSQADLRLNEFKNKQNAEEPWCISTGFPELDNIVQGWTKGEEFVVIFARTGQGKSWVLVKTATHAWKLGFRVGYISPEMSANKIGYRFDTLNEHFSNTGLLSGNAENYEDYINELIQNGRPMYVATPVDFNKRITVSKLRTFCIENRLDMLCVDGIKYLTDERAHRNDNLTTQLTNISEDLMYLSMELQIPVLVVVQSNRQGVRDNEGNQGTPDLENIRDSDGIAHNATKVISLRQTGPGLEMGIKKNRDGANNVKLVYTWDIDTGTFTYVPGESDMNAIPTTSHSSNNTNNTKRSKGKSNSNNNERNTLADVKPEPRMAFADKSSPF